MTSSPPPSPSAASISLPTAVDEGGDGGDGGHAHAPLTGVGVLVTRPREQASRLMQDLTRLGAHPVLFPALAILPPQDSVTLGAALANLGRYHLAIFISPTAALRGMAAARQAGRWPPGLAVAAIGKGTAKTLREQGIQAVLEPQGGADSEHLLALPQLQRVAGTRIIIFRGEGGREMLAETLRQRGAQVDYAECYRRGPPQDADPAPVLALFEAGAIQAVTAYSSETLDNLLALLGDRGKEFLARTPLFVPHPRIAGHARDLGMERVVESANEETQLPDRLVEYFAHD